MEKPSLPSNTKNGFTASLHVIGVSLWLGLLGLVAGMAMLFYLGLIVRGVNVRTIWEGLPWMLGSALVLAVVGAIAGITALYLPNLARHISWLFGRRAVCGYVWVSAILVSLVVLFYTVESWRGKRAWNQLAQEMKAKGEKLDLASLAPPAVPADQDFARIPLFAPLFEAEELAVHGLTGYIQRATDLVQRFSLQQQPHTYYWEPFDGDWRRQKMTDWAGRQNYLREVKHLTHLPSATTPAEAVLSALQTYREPPQEVIQASQRPYARFPIRCEFGLLASPLHPVILGKLGQILRLRAVASLVLNQTEKTLLDIQTILSLANDPIR